MKLGWEEDSGQKKNLSFYKQIQTFQILKQGISFGEGFNLWLQICTFDRILSTATY